MEIDDLYVDRSLRSQGVGGLLLKEPLATARRGRIRKVHVHTGTKDVRRILEFYESHGFRGWGVQMHEDL